MLHVPTIRAKPGMRLALPVQHPQRAAMLLTEGFVLDEAIIRKLIELEIHDLWIEYPNTEQIKEYVSPAILNQQSQLVGTVANMFDAVHREAHTPTEFAAYRKTLRGLIESLVNDPAASSYIVELGGRADSDLRHASEVCFVSLLLGLKLQGYLIQQRRRLNPRDARDVVSLGLGAMVHDIGKTQLPPEVLERHDRTGDDSDPQWRNHVVLGHKLVSGTIAPAAAGVVLHHHQHFDGSGFPAVASTDGRPCGLAGEQIHVFARIVCVANYFDRMRRPVYGKAAPRVRVLNQMLNTSLSARFDPIILAALPMVVPAYPPGSVVKLNSGERAAVVQWHSESPCQPTVQALGSDDQATPRERDHVVRYDLRTMPDVRIIEHDGVDVGNDNFLVNPLPLTFEKTAA